MQFTGGYRRQGQKVSRLKIKIGGTQIFLRLTAMKSKTFIRIVLGVVLAASVCSLIVLRMGTIASDKKIEEGNNMLKQQKLRNNEMEDLLSEENEEDFYKDAAEKHYGYGKSDEKVYLDVTGQ